MRVTRIRRHSPVQHLRNIQSASSITSVHPLGLMDVLGRFHEGKRVKIERLDPRWNQIIGSSEREHIIHLTDLFAL